MFQAYPYYDYPKPFVCNEIKNGNIIQLWHHYMKISEFFCENLNTISQINGTRIDHKINIVLKYLGSLGFLDNLSKNIYDANCNNCQIDMICLSENIRKNYDVVMYKHILLHDMEIDSTKDCVKLILLCNSII